MTSIWTVRYRSNCVLRSVCKLLRSETKQSAVFYEVFVFAASDLVYNQHCFVSPFLPANNAVTSEQPPHTGHCALHNFTTLDKEQNFSHILLQIQAKYYSVRSTDTGMSYNYTVCGAIIRRVKYQRRQGVPKICTQVGYQ